MAGLPGSGKSTVSRRLAREIDAVVLESDALRRLLFDAPTHTPAESKRLFRALHAAARELLEAGVSVIIDTTNSLERDRRPVHTLAATTGAHLVVVHVTAPESMIEQRLAARSKDEAGIEVYLRMAAQFQAPGDAWPIDTSDADGTDAALRAIAAVCRPEVGVVRGGKH